MNKYLNIFKEEFIHELGAVVLGGIRRIASVASYLVPMMALAYILMSLVVILQLLDGLTMATQYMDHMDIWIPMMGNHSLLDWKVVTRMQILIM